MSSAFPAATLPMTLLSTAHGIFTPVSTSVASRYARPNERGVLLGLFQSVGGFGRVVGPVYAGTAFVQLGFGSPYLIGALLMVPCVLLSLAVIRQPAPA